MRAVPGRADGWTLLAGAELQQRPRDRRRLASTRARRRAVDRALSLRARRPGRADPARARWSSRATTSAARPARRAGRAPRRPDRPGAATAPLVDAAVELGRYGEAERLAQEMVDRKPDLAALARVSYLRELRGDRAGALTRSPPRAAPAASCRRARRSSRAAGGLELQLGRLARRAPRRAASRCTCFPGYAAAEAALARAEAAAATPAPRSRRLRALVDRLPLPEHVTLLGRDRARRRAPCAARRDLDLVARRAARCSARPA